MIDRWAKLWDIATSSPLGEEDPTIAPTDNPNTVVLTWPDGSSGTWDWENNNWHAAEALSMCPGDVAARDSL